MTTASSDLWKKLQDLWLALEGGPQRVCRDCADHDGACPNDGGLPCDPQERALEQIKRLRLAAASQPDREARLPIQPEDGRGKVRMREGTPEEIADYKAAFAMNHSPAGQAAMVPMMEPRGDNPPGIQKLLEDFSTGELFNALLSRINFDGMDPRTFSLCELHGAIEGAEWPSLLSGAGDGGFEPFGESGGSIYPWERGAARYAPDDLRPSDPSPGPDVREALEELLQLAVFDKRVRDPSFNPRNEPPDSPIGKALAALTRPLGESQP